MIDDDEGLTELLDEVYEQRPGALDELVERVYTSLQKVAERHLRADFGPHLAGATLEPAALANETFLRLIKQRQRYDNRGHFFAIATRLMLRVLADYHRSRGTRKRGGDQVRVSLNQLGGDPNQASVVDLLVFVEAIENLEKLHRRSGEIAEMRLIWGLTIPEIAESLSFSVATVEKDWRFARSWLAEVLRPAS